LERSTCFLEPKGHYFVIVIEWSDERGCELVHYAHCYLAVPGVRIEKTEGLTLLTVYFGAPSMFITLRFGFDYGTNPPLGTLII
jgi:hypothetical protein